MTTLFGSRIRDYEIWGQIGEGGMSEVWLAKHAVLGLPVIIKTLRGTIADKGAIVNEARLMARISNPRVLRKSSHQTIGTSRYAIHVVSGCVTMTGPSTGTAPSTGTSSAGSVGTERPAPAEPKNRRAITPVTPVIASVSAVPLMI